MNSDRIAEVLSAQNKYKFLSYLITPIFLIIKICILSAILFIYFFLSNEKIQYSDCMKIILIGEFVLIIAMIVRICCLIEMEPTDFDTLQYFTPLSIVQLINLKKLPKYLFYPMQLLNLFEVAYWLMLAYGIRAFTNWKFSKSLKSVAFSYGLTLLIWTVIIIFIQVQFS